MTRNRINNFGRHCSHRKLMFVNLAKSLILHKRIFTTLAKAKALRKTIEPILTIIKKDSIHTRRTFFSFFQDKEIVKEAFGKIAPKILDRPGGYCRIIKMEKNRPGDNSSMSMIELVDFNQIYSFEEEASTVKKTRRSNKKKTINV
jgi:large subunit ribosomal protein L17